jgi:hypothetical protein
VVAGCGGNDGAGADGGGGSAAGGHGGAQTPRDGGAGGNGGGSGGSGAGGGGVCPVGTPCGGDVVGTWTITDSCVSFSASLSNVCIGLTAAGTFTYAGSATYRADLTYTQTSTIGGAFQYDYPSTCLNGYTCAQLGTALLAAGSAMGTFSSVSCRGNNGGCLCDTQLANPADNETGTYAVSGSTLLTTHDGTTDSTDYCVSGNVMRQLANGSATTDEGPATVSGSITLTRQ